MYKFLNETVRDAENIVVWCDNCSGQNKNWTLYSVLVYCMFSKSNSLKTVTLRYFEKGHTLFMSADAFHHLVEKNIRQTKFLYDFNDYRQCVEKAGVAVEMNAIDFF